MILRSKIYFSEMEIVTRLNGFFFNRILSFFLRATTFEKHWCKGLRQGRKPTLPVP